MKFIDALYGEIDIPIDKDILTLPELQRLREIRLCNINSPFITGACNINRFEHAIGTGFLANRYCSINKITTDRDLFIIASLLHDIVTPPFGHSLEYIYESLGKTQYEHANLETFFTGKTIQHNLPYYMGKKSKIKRNEVSFDRDAVYKILNGSHELSNILVNDIDIDNIDNVFRLAFHVGIDFEKSTPIELVNNIVFHDSKIKCNDDAMYLVEEWFRVREILYVYLLENEYEFVAKALLERIIIDMIKEDKMEVEDWFLTDSQFIQVAFHSENKNVKRNTTRLMTMDFPDSHVIYITNDISKVDAFQKEKIHFIDNCYEKYGVFVHFIRDVSKTRRPIKVESLKTGMNYTIGRKADRYLIGMFADLPEVKAREIFKLIKAELSNSVGINIKELSFSGPPTQQLSLF